MAESPYDLVYLTVDSISEGVGSSQVEPLLRKIAAEGLKVKLINFEKVSPSSLAQDTLRKSGIEWQYFDFLNHGLGQGIKRVSRLAKAVPDTSLIHGRSELGALAGIMSGRAPVLWDVRSLWASQREFLSASQIQKSLYKSLKIVENVCSFNSSGLSTLTRAVVPILESRHFSLPSERIVVPTNVDLKLFKAVKYFPKAIKALFSGTYNDYYDLSLSSRFLRELSCLSKVDVHWARPRESKPTNLGTIESSVFVASQREMPNIIPEYSFGMSVCKLDAGPSLSAAMPTKAAEFLACGRPIVINEGLGDLPEIIREFNIGVVLDGSTRSLLEGSVEMLDLLGDKSTPARCRIAAEKYFDLDAGVKKYLSIYSKISE
jgi:hypothetical protein